MDLIWRSFEAPPLEGYEPAAMIAVLVATDPQGRVARYPLYGQIAIPVKLFTAVRHKGV